MRGISLKGDGPSPDTIMNDPFGAIKSASTRRHWHPRSGDMESEIARCSPRKKLVLLAQQCVNSRIGLQLGEKHVGRCREGRNCEGGLPQLRGSYLEGPTARSETLPLEGIIGAERGRVLKSRRHFIERIKGIEGIDV